MPMFYKNRRSVVHSPLQRILLPLSILAILNGCSDTSLVVTGDKIGTEQVSDAPIEVFAERVIQSAFNNFDPTEFAAAIEGEVNLFGNRSFESGTRGWSSCDTDLTLSTSRDAYKGKFALEVPAEGCFYRSAQVIPGDELLLTCAAKVKDANIWTAMGLGFATANWKVIDRGAPSLITSQGEYAKYSKLP